jgi:hypothetical protein
VKIAALLAPANLLATACVPATCKAEMLMQVGAAPALPTGSGEVVRFSAGITVGAGVSLAENFSAGIAVRRHHEDGLSRALTSALIYFRSDVSRHNGFSFFATGLAGPSLFTGCVESGACDAWGAMMGMGVGIAVPVAERARFLIALEPTLQWGMPQDTGFLFMPMLTLGIALWDAPERRHASRSHGPGDVLLSASRI